MMKLLNAKKKHQPETSFIMDKVFELRDDKRSDRVIFRKEQVLH